jgi:hypothetical protein
MAVHSLSRLRGRAGWGCLTGTPALAEAFPHPDRIFDAIRPPPQAGEVQRSSQSPTIPTHDSKNGPIFARAKAGRAWILAHHSLTQGCLFAVTSCGAISSSIRLTKGTAAISAIE